MKDLQTYVIQAKEILDSLNIPYVDCNVSVNSRLAKSWGYCRHWSFNRTLGIWNNHCIELNKVLLLDSTSDDALMNTLLHEYLHTCPKCDNHKSVWQKYARMINEKYNYNIKRTTSAQEKNISIDENYKYTVKCIKCNHDWGYNKTTRVIKHIELRKDKTQLKCPYCNEVHNQWSVHKNR